MFLYFKFSNYKSFKNEILFSMIAGNSSEFPENTFQEKNFQLLKSSVIYGANASGKSNFFDAVTFFIDFIKNSQLMGVEEYIECPKFLLSTESQDSPVNFEISFILENNIYRYGFSIENGIISKEWLYINYTRKETLLFKRNYQKFTIGSKFQLEKNIEKKTKENTLFLSVLGQWNNETAIEIIKWIKKIHVLKGNSVFSPMYTSNQIKSNRFKGKILTMLKDVDINFEGVKIEEKNINIDEISNEMTKIILDKLKNNNNNSDIKTMDVIVQHSKYDENNNFKGIVDFDLKKQESEGTKKFYSLAGPILDTIEKNGILFIDELENSLHPLILEYILKLFNNENLNKKAQIIFSTHNTNILDTKKLRRDQIWFTEKNRYGESVLYSLLEIKGEREGQSFERKYLKGNYGGIPIVSDEIGECYEE
ncbi:MAG TPA: ATP-binding protein [Tepiditoga sp.]|nr:ATP-binding protein [Tepiditoga sp.]